MGRESVYLGLGGRQKLWDTLHGRPSLVFCSTESEYSALGCTQTLCNGPGVAKQGCSFVSKTQEDTKRN